MADTQDMYDALAVVAFKLSDLKVGLTPREEFLINQAMEELYGIDGSDLEASFQTSNYNTENE
jgi:hypothetical protein